MKSNTSEKDLLPHTPRNPFLKWLLADYYKYNETCRRAMVKYYINNKEIVSERKTAWYQRRKAERQAQPEIPKKLNS